jgi:hypothetical protein
MSQIPAEVIVTDLPDGVHYRFPLRPRGAFVWSGIAHIVAGAIGVAFMTFWLSTLGAEIPWKGVRDANGIVLLFFGLGCFMMMMTLWLAAQGVTLLIGHSEIRLRAGRLYSFECWGPLCWPWGRDVAGLIRFDVRDVSVGKGSVAMYDTPEAATKYNAITALWKSDGDLAPEKRKHLAWGYPREWLLPVAEDLSRRCRLATEPSSMVTAPAAPVPVGVEPLPNRGGFVDLIEQPAGSEIQVQRLYTWLRLTRPKAFTLEVEENKLRVEQRKVFGVREYRWSRDQLAEIKVGKHVDSEGPDTPLLLIRPHPGEGDLLSLPVKEETDARWLATLLRDALQLPESDWTAAGGAFCERNERPSDSPIVFERDDDRLTFMVPVYGMGRRPTGEYVGAFFLSIFVAGIAFALLHIPGNKAWIQGWGLTPLQGAVLTAIGVTVLMIVAVIQQAKRHALLILDDVKLLVRQSGLFRTNEQVVLRSRIADVRVGYHIHRWAGATMRQTVQDTGGVPWELQVFLNDGERVGVLDGLRAEELQWVATILRREILGTVPVSTA